ncbi:MAG: GreA/GreB family elongation factor [Chloroflexi bacterium]|nr:GreA/GreB family elongation factor [Chloroflexota bacterium]
MLTDEGRWNMTDEAQNLTLGEAANRFVRTLLAENRGAGQQEVNRFVRWFGPGHILSGLTGSEIANYAEQLSTSDADFAGKLEGIREFLAFAKKEGWSKTNLAVHLKVKKAKAKKEPAAQPSRPVRPEATMLTREGLAGLEEEMAGLKSKRLEVIEEIRRAAADKDFRENVPLHAAREQKSHIEGRILQLEEMLKSAVLLEEQQRSTMCASIGDSVILCNLDDGGDHCYVLVNPREVDAARGKISSASPIGKAIVGREEGDVIEVTAPAGKQRFQVKKIERR